MRTYPLPSQETITDLKSLGNGIIELLESLFRVYTRAEIFELHQNTLIQIPAILNQEATYITVGSILSLRPTNLLQSYTQESSTEIVIGRSHATIANYVEDAFCMAVLENLLSNDGLSEIYS